ncbi:MAG: cytochrome B [Stenotrophomonas acidaminiphila]|nr:MAG: cytochrome B [Stenotrophomonas acidaminiphila]
MSTISSQGYHRGSILLHWAMLALFVIVYASIELRTVFEKGSDARATMKDLHFMFGLSIFALVWVRLVLRAVTRRPPIVPPPPAWQRIASTVVHMLLYVFMIGMPLAGWLTLSAADEPIPFFGLQVPPLTGPDMPFALKVHKVHETAGTVGYWLVGLHALAALAHHYLWKDNTLRRMLASGTHGVGS